MTPNDIFSEMYSKDEFSQWLGIELIEIGSGYCKLSMTIRPDMLNGFKIAHGGITYSLADSALAFASNADGKKAVSIETSISHTERLKAGDLIFAEAEKQTVSSKIGRYNVKVTKSDDTLVALFNGTVYRTKENW